MEGKARKRTTGRKTAAEEARRYVAEHGVEAILEEIARDSEELLAEVRLQATDAQLSPLAYVIGVMNSPLIDAERRDKMAIAALPYFHARKDVVVGKKEEREAAAQRAAERFETPEPPKLRVVNDGG